VKKYMPNKDGTGPLGQGPSTGRGLGPCCRGSARGFRRRFRYPIVQQIKLTKEQEKKILEEEKQELELELKTIQEKLKELK
jgi:hypothetical protein